MVGVVFMAYLGVLYLCMASCLIAGVVAMGFALGPTEAFLCVNVGLIATVVHVSWAKSVWRECVEDWRDARENGA